MTIDRVDIHTHNTLATPPSVISVAPGYDFDAERLYSVGIHPWASADASPSDLDRLRADARRDNVVAIGECGLDKLRGAPLERQIELLRSQISISEDVEKPMILHVVKAYSEIIALRRELRPRQRWIIHGFRGGREMAQQLITHGFDLSYGERFNPAAVAVTPLDRLHVETDESTLPIAAIAERLTQSLNNGTI